MPVFLFDILGNYVLLWLLFFSFSVVQYSEIRVKAFVSPRRRHLNQFWTEAHPSSYEPRYSSFRTNLQIFSLFLDIWNEYFFAIYLLNRYFASLSYNVSSASRKYFLRPVQLGPLIEDFHQ